MTVEVHDFLLCPTPESWLYSAKKNTSLLLIDHANCEKKAASSALQLAYRYTEKPDVLIKFSRLAREEMLHFEQVVSLMAARNLKYLRLSPSRYAGELKRCVRKEESGILVDTLLVGAIIEARSCERFGALVPILDDELARFYSSLLKLMLVAVCPNISSTCYDRQ